VSGEKATFYTLCKKNTVIW